ncbi:PH domain-containing protein [Paenibacillus thermoaerophilus]|uniref:PH domain-containing protein n=1 Tax=Paenibacillus thermoaerophilus TaxID=1215385 RepID=A0ABW2V056_9BACL|nr:PH domain-containing protein [Paenibacillus thermoaerophilus]TMV17733.1 hypothetical protein FE781_06280 [Paenibacillus thermoaerophilus]
MRFESKKDVWIGAIIWAAALAGFGASVVASAQSRAALPALLMMIAALLFVSWIWFGTYYIVSERFLIVRGGPFRWRIPIADVVSVRPARHPLSSPALSLDRLEIVYGNGPDRKTILVSPDDPESFRQAIRQFQPQALLMSE